MTTTVSTTWLHDGRALEIVAEMSAPEHDVGVCGPVLESLTIFGEHGVQIVDDILNDALMEDEGLYVKLNQAYYEMHTDDHEE